MLSLIDAGPGTGKTFTIVYAGLKLLQSVIGTITFTEEQQKIIDFVCSEFPRGTSIAYFCHSNSVKETLEKRIGSKKIKVYTFNGAGQSAIFKARGYGFQKLVNNRTEQHIQEITGENLKEMDWDDKRKWFAIKRLIYYFKTEDIEPTLGNLNYLLLKYPDLSNYRVPDDWLEWTQMLLSRSLRVDGNIEFADQLWMGAHVARPRFDLGFVDESQDVSKIMYKLVTRMCRHVMFCGDKNQAINAFAGASEEMYQHIASRSDAILPLKVTQRCPAGICEMANKIRPGGIILGPNTAETVVENIELLSLPEKLESPGIWYENTLLVARTNAVTIGTALFLHKRKIPCKVIGRKLEEELLNFIKSFKTTDIKVLGKLVRGYKEKSSRSRNRIWTQICTDKADTVLSLCAEADSYSSLLLLLKSVFDTEQQGFSLSTLHRAKGLEADHIFILNPPIELPMCMEHPIQREQEINLHFMGVTRSSKNLYWVK